MRRESNRGGWAFPLALAAVTGLFLLAFGLHPLLKEAATIRELPGKDISYDSRIQMWQGTLALIADHPLWGTGPGTYVSSFPPYRPAGLAWLIDYAHNDYLQVAAEMGLPALVMLVGMIGAALWVGVRTFLRTRSTFKGGLSLGAAGGITAMAVHSLVDFGLHVPANALLFAVLLGVVAR